MTRADSQRRAAAARTLRNPSSDGPLDEDQLTRLLGYNLSRAELRMRRFFHQYMDRFALRPAEYSALVLIACNTRLNQKKLGEALEVSAPNLAVLLDKLTERGLLVRVRSEEDRRAQHLHLTVKGRALLARSEASVTRMEQAIVAMLSRGERALLIELLQKLATTPPPAEAPPA